MSARVARRAPAWWFDGAPVPAWAALLEPLYAGATALRRRLYRTGVLKPVAAGVPVLVIGNLIAGGSGKTPLAIAVASRLRDAGWTPGIATRGYGRDSRDPRWVEASSNAAQVGDEALLLARGAGVPVRVDADRAAAARALAAAGCDLVVCDDGLQHYGLARDLEIEVLDARRRHGNGRLLPAGPLREPATRGERCQFRVLNVADGDAGLAGFGEWPMQLLPGDALPLAGGRPRPLAEFAGQRVHAVAGIGDPERFFAMLRGLGIAPVPHAFPDHHRYAAQDLRFASDLPILMTAKDAANCMGLAPHAAWQVPVEPRLPEAFWTALLDRLGPLKKTAPHA